MNVLVKADDLLNSLGDIYYGNYACSKEIDFSSVIIDSINAIYNSETKSYSVVTSEADWEIKIVGNEDLIVKNANKHTIYVWMRLGKFTETKPESTNEYYQSAGGGYYVPLPDSIDISKNDLAGFLYRGDYSVFCIVKTFLKNNTTGIPTTSVCKLGDFTVFNEDNVGIVTISMVDCLPLTINPVEIYLNMLDVNTNKYYDGTNIVKTNNGGKASEKTEIALLQNYEFSNLTNKISKQNDKVNMTYTLGLVPVEYNNYKYNLLDTPGYFDFCGEVISSLTASDAAIIVIDATTDIQVGTEKSLELTEDVPKIMFINKIDNEIIEKKKYIAKNLYKSQIKVLEGMSQMYPYENITKYEDWK